MHAVSAVRHLGVLSILILVAGLSFLVARWPRGRHATFSAHAASQHVTVWYYIVLFAVSLPLLTVFFVWWFVPTFHVTGWFLLLAVSSELLQHSVTLIPETGGWKTKWHRRLTASSAVLLLPMLGIMAGSSRISSFARGVTLLCAAGMVLIVVYQIGVKDRTAPRNQLVFQTMYYALFFIPILAATYLR